MSFLDHPPESGVGKYRPLLLSIILSQGVGAAATIFTTPQIPTWYAGLVHPAIAPPNWLFAPVWTTLYLLMAVAAWRVWRKTGLKSAAMIAYAVQLALNFGWSGLFFGLHRIEASLLEIVVLDLAILVTALLFLRHDRTAGLLLLPYLAWALFATVLTHAFWTLNPG